MNHISMPHRIKVTLNGQPYEAVHMPIQTSQEHWNEYILDDGTVLRMKTVVAAVYKVEGLMDKDGNPVYHIKSSNVATAIPPKQD